MRGNLHCFFLVITFLYQLPSFFFASHSALVLQHTFQAESCLGLFQLLITHGSHGLIGIIVSPTYSSTVKSMWEFSSAIKMFCVVPV